MYIKHTSRHYYKLGSNREFYDQENPFSPEVTDFVVDFQNKYDGLIQYLEDCYHALRAGSKAPETPSWLEDEVKSALKQSEQATVAVLNNQSLSLQLQQDKSNTNVSESLGNQNQESTLQTSASPTVS